MTLGRRERFFGTCADSNSGTTSANSSPFLSKDAQTLSGPLCRCQLPFALREARVLKHSLAAKMHHGCCGTPAGFQPDIMVLYPIREVQDKCPSLQLFHQIGGFSGTKPPQGETAAVMGPIPAAKPALSLPKGRHDPAAGAGLSPAGGDFDFFWVWFCATLCRCSYHGWACLTKGHNEPQWYWGPNPSNSFDDSQSGPSL
jgi:hypothetical protein